MLCPNLGGALDRHVLLPPMARPHRRRVVEDVEHPLWCGGGEGWAGGAGEELVRVVDAVRWQMIKWRSYGSSQQSVIKRCMGPPQSGLGSGFDGWHPYKLDESHRVWTFVKWNPTHSDHGPLWVRADRRGRPPAHSPRGRHRRSLGRAAWRGRVARAGARGDRAGRDEALAPAQEDAQQDDPLLLAHLLVPARVALGLAEDRPEVRPVECGGGGVRVRILAAVAAAARPDPERVEHISHQPRPRPMVVLPVAAAAELTDVGDRRAALQEGRPREAFVPWRCGRGGGVVGAGRGASWEEALLVEGAAAAGYGHASV